MSSENLQYNQKPLEDLWFFVVEHINGREKNRVEKNRVEKKAKQRPNSLGRIASVAESIPFKRSDPPGIRSMFPHTTF